MRLRAGKRKFFLLPVFVLIAYLGVVGVFYFMEDSFVYFPREGLRSPDASLRVETVELVTPDSVRIVGWIIPAQNQDSSTVWFLYLHGNGGNISSRGYVSHYRNFQSLGINTFAIDYRGYGASEGSPEEQGLYIDAATAFQYLVRERNISPQQIILFGYSLGSAVASELATKVEAGGIVLEGAFASAPDVGQASYPFLPVKWMMKNRFDSMSRIHQVDEPKLFLHALQDEIVPFEHGRRLYEAANHPKKLVQTAGGHNTAHTADSARFYAALMDFVKTTSQSSR